MKWEYTACLIEVGSWESFIMWEELAFECTETYHVVPTPVLIKELTSTLIKKFLKRWSMVNCRSSNVATNLIEEAHRCITVGCGTSTYYSFSLS